MSKQNFNSQKYTKQSLNNRYFDDMDSVNYSKSKKICKQEKKRRKEARFSKSWQEPINY